MAATVRCNVFKYYLLCYNSTKIPFHQLACMCFVMNQSLTLICDLDLDIDLDIVCNDCTKGNNSKHSTIKNC